MTNLLELHKQVNLMLSMSRGKKKSDSNSNSTYLGSKLIEIAE